MPLQNPPHVNVHRMDTPRHPDNPAGADWEKMDLAAGPFFQCHTNIAELKSGDVIAVKELGPSAQVERLLGLGAISPAAPEHVEAYKEYLGTLPPRAKAEGEAPRDPGPADIPDAGRKVEGPAPGGGFSGPPKSADKK